MIRADALTQEPAANKPLLRAGRSSRFGCWGRNYLWREAGPLGWGHRRGCAAVVPALRR